MDGTHDLNRKVGEKKISCGGVIDLAVEQPQLFRKLHKNKNKSLLREAAPAGLSAGLWTTASTVESSA